MRYFDGIGNLTDVQIRTGLEKVARVKRVAEKMNVNKIPKRPKTGVDNGRETVTV